MCLADNSENTNINEQPLKKIWIGPFVNMLNFGTNLTDKFEELEQMKSELCVDEGASRKQVTKGAHFGHMTPWESKELAFS